MSGYKTSVDDSYSRLIVEARSFLAGSGKATLLGRLTDALEWSNDLTASIRKLQADYRRIVEVGDYVDDGEAVVYESVIEDLNQIMDGFDPYG